ncbi:DUF4360 domain-containing protein [Krasilnikovia sp. MM14-A1259]|uniref:DUF4360 domain-containing protein n=1 Tax=Krasilnikovia sp. MM14-A1259 TaxID=3373539 RepID=UPI00399CEAC8
MEISDDVERPSRTLHQLDVGSFGVDLANQFTPFLDGGGPVAAKYSVVYDDIEDLRSSMASRRKRVHDGARRHGRRCRSVRHHGGSAPGTGAIPPPCCGARFAADPAKQALAVMLRRIRSGVSWWWARIVVRCVSAASADPHRMARSNVHRQNMGTRMSKVLKSLLAAAAALGVIGVSTPVSAAPASNTPPPGRITVRLVTANGTGCPLGTTTVAPFQDNQGFTVTYGAYTAQAGGGVSPLENRKNCQLAVEAQVPQGFTYAIAQVTYRGYMQLGADATGLQKASYYFAGDPATAQVQKSFQGPNADNWSVTHQAESYVWAPCSTTRNININSELRVSSSSATAPVSFMTMDSTDAGISTVYQFSWRRC